MTLATLIQAIERSSLRNAVTVIVQQDSVMHRYLQEAGATCLHLIHAPNPQQFLRRALSWVNQQPRSYPLLLDNCAERSLLPTLLSFAVPLRLSGRPIYHFCHDLARSHNWLGNLLRKLTFACLAPQAICNSSFTAKHISSIMPKIQGILYQPVDFDRFNPAAVPPPAPLQPILDSGAKIMLTPSRISQAGIVNDKNLRALIPVLAELKARGYHYHSVIIGEDRSPEQSNTKSLLISATYAGVADRLTILPPAIEIENYYRHADVVVTLAPREPFGRVVVEAISCGVPVVGSCTGGVGEILQQCAAPWAVDPQDIEAIVDRILEVTSGSQNGSVKAQAQAWVQKYCSIFEYRNQLLQIVGITA